MKRSFFLFMLWFALSACTRDPYGPLIAKFHESEEWEKRVFDRLVFTPSPIQLKKSLVFKFVMRDQLGRDWLFKGGRETSDGAVASYRIYKLFGLDTPEIHYKALRVHDEVLEGTAQRFIDNIGNIRIYDALPPQVMEYLAKSHVMSWLLTSHHVHPRQFILLADEKQNINGIQRIDHSIEWFLMGHDKLDMDYETPMLFDVASAGFGNFWRHYLYRGVKNFPDVLAENPRLKEYLNKMSFDLPLRDIHQWACFISQFPDSEYKNFFANAVKNELKYLANAGANAIAIQAPETLLGRDIKAAPKAFLDGLLSRKKNLCRDLKGFYANISRLRGETFAPAERIDGEKIAAEMMRKLDAKIEALKSDYAKLEKIGPLEQKTIDIDHSRRAHEIYTNLLITYKMRYGVAIALVERALGQIDSLESRYETEKNAIRKASHAVAELLRDLKTNYTNPERKIFIDANRLISSQ